MDMYIPDWPRDGVRWDGISIRSVFGSFFKIRHLEQCWDYTCNPSLLLDSRRICTFLIDLEMVLSGMESPSEVSLKVSSMPDIRNHVKTPPALQVSSWSLGGHGQSQWTWKWERTSIKSFSGNSIKIQLVLAVLEKILSCRWWWWWGDIGVGVME